MAGARRAPAILDPAAAPPAWRNGSPARLAHSAAALRLLKRSTGCGPAGAGASLAFACDFRIASDKAKFFQAFVKVGLVPDSGSTYFLPRLVGTAKATELAMLGDIIDANEALRLGLVNKVVPADDLAAETRGFAERLAAGPTRAYALTKKAIRFGAVQPLENALDYEADLQNQIALSADHLEGVKAFIEKRDPKFQGR